MQDREIKDAGSLKSRVKSRKVARSPTNARHELLTPWSFEARRNKRLALGSQYQ